MNNQKVVLIAPVIVPEDHPSLVDHFPGRPLAPGALLLDIVVAAYQARFPERRVTEITKAKFLKPAPPGIVFTLTVTKETSGLAIFKLLDENDVLFLSASLRFDPA